jgi:ribosome-binding protein aMBF1 (putative translation factor)
VSKKYEDEATVRFNAYVQETYPALAEDVLAEDLRDDPEFAAEWERTALARAVALAVVRYRITHKLSQSALADRLGMRQPHIARLEAGDHNPSLKMLQRLARCLGLRITLDVAPPDRPRR